LILVAFVVNDLGMNGCQILKIEREHVFVFLMSKFVCEHFFFKSARVRARARARVRVCQPSNHECLFPHKTTCRTVHH